MSAFEVAGKCIPGSDTSEPAPPAGRTAVHMVVVAEDLARIAADIDMMYRCGGHSSNPIALHDALHAVHRALVALDDTNQESLERPALRELDRDSNHLSANSPEMAKSTEPESLGKAAMGSAAGQKRGYRGGLRGLTEGMDGAAAALGRRMTVMRFQADGQG